MYVWSLYYKEGEVRLSSIPITINDGCVLKACLYVQTALSAAPKSHSHRFSILSIVPMPLLLSMWNQGNREAIVSTPPANGEPPEQDIYPQHLLFLCSLSFNRVEVSAG